ncbi:hypothetical protein SAY87_025806 [Trapa incisa]|uniref:Uncharacterized protein n=1 Tax=Trapa incisa TaxID=236973 RepID=A0AAN7JJE9_9MYRT|nr:hypothetical protein SAY87_025806 [Trapa incisa]
MVKILCIAVQVVGSMNVPFEHPHPLPLQLHPELPPPDVSELLQTQCSGGGGRQQVSRVTAIFTEMDGMIRDSRVAPSPDFHWNSTTTTTLWKKWRSERESGRLLELEDG